MKYRRIIQTVCICGVIAFLLAGCQNLKDIQGLQIENINFQNVKDGSYEGLQDNWMVTAKVTITIASGIMTAAKLLEHNHGPNHSAEGILDEVLKNQNLLVDAISGSTYSSKVVLKAIEIALKKGQ